MPSSTPPGASPFDTLPRTPRPPQVPATGGVPAATPLASARPGTPAIATAITLPAGQRAVRAAAALLWRIRLALGAPNAATFELLRPTARARTTVALVALAGLVGGVCYNAGRPTGSPLAQSVWWGALAGPVCAAIAFGAASGVLHALARLLGGTGSYHTYSYLLALGACPLAMLAALVGALPVVGPPLAALAALYGVVLMVPATIAAHRLPAERALLVVLLGVLVDCLLLLLALLLTLLATVKSLG